MAARLQASSDAELTVHTGSGFADNRYCFNQLLLCIFNFLLLNKILWIATQPKGCLVIYLFLRQMSFQVSSVASC